MRYINTRLLLLLLLLPCEMQSAKLFQIMQKIPLKKSHFNFDTHVNVAGSTNCILLLLKSYTKYKIKHIKTKVKVNEIR